MAEDDLPVLEKKIKQMMKFKEHLFKDAKANIDQAQSHYKQDYDRKRSASEVFVDCIHNLLRCSCETTYILKVLEVGEWCCSEIASKIQRRATK